MGIHDSLHCSFVDYVPHACAKVMPFADVPLARAFVAPVAHRGQGRDSRRRVPGARG